MTNDSFEQRPLPSDATVTLFEEEASVGIQEVTTGRVRIATRVETFQELAQADLRSDVVDITHVPIDKTVVGDLPTVRVEGDLTIFPVFEEVLVVERRLVLKEEIHIRRRTTVERVQAPVTLRRQVADVERTEGAKPT